MVFFQKLFQTLIELSPDSVLHFAEYVGPWMYVVLFAIIFAETGLVAVPFLPGDSLLFAVGAVAALPGSPVNLWLTAILLVAAAILGDAVNYFIGYKIGPRIFASERSWLLNKKHLIEAQNFYEKHGGKTIIIARFMPIVRTFAPFVAGIGRMNYWRFAIYNVIGGTVWVVMFLVAGWAFGMNKAVQRNFKVIIIAIIVISVLPAVIEYLRARLRRAKPDNHPATPADDMAKSPVVEV